jgi:hypothetical protein
VTSEKDTELVQKLDRLQPFTAVFPPECAGPLASFGPAYHLSRCQFVASAEAAGVGYGFYYSIMKSFYLCHSFSGQNSCGSEVLPGLGRIVALSCRSSTSYQIR